MLCLFKPMKWIVVLSISCLIFINQSFAEVAVIVHLENNSEFDQTFIKKVFLGKTKSFSNGRTAILLNASQDDPIREQFNSVVLGKSTNQVNAYWSKMMFTGKGVPPQEMASTAEIISAIAENKDAISYIDASAVTSAVKVVGKF
jgi:ABC-type phosphate transport system substrate-binding protein